ncbi:hypothetical protein [Bhargavaea cecembensis]|nr:hypothetical protein [Bhargavaea cecembensis]
MIDAEGGELHSLGGKFALCDEGLSRQRRMIRVGRTFNPQDESSKG